MIDKFHEDKNVFVFLISTLAGGTGLNLTGADKVVIFGTSSIFTFMCHHALLNCIPRPRLVQIQIGVRILLFPTLRANLTPYILI